MVKWIIANKFTFILIWWLTSMLLLACNSGKSVHKKWHELKTADFADLLENANDFIETPYFDSICGRLNDSVVNYMTTIFYLEEDLKYTNKINYKIEEPEDYLKISCTNYFDICLRSEDSIYIEDESSSFSEVTDYVKWYVANPTEIPAFSEKVEKDIKYIGEAMVSKGWIYFVLNYFSQKRLSVKTWKQYFGSIELIKQAFYELRDEYSIVMWETSYNKLEYEKKEALSELYPINVIIQFSENCGIPEIPPPPTERVEEILDIVDD